MKQFIRIAFYLIFASLIYSVYLVFSGVVSGSGALMQQQTNQHEDAVASKKHFSVLTYNIHSCVGSDDIYSVDRIAAVVKKENADIVCLQEVEVNDDTSSQLTRVWSKPHQDDQPAMIAAKAGYQYYKFAPAIRSTAQSPRTEAFHPVDSNNGGMFGVALLSKYPIIDHKIVMFAPYGRKTQRNVLACQIEIPNACSDTSSNQSSDSTCDEERKRRIWVLSTHLGMHIQGGEQYQQAVELKLFVENLLSPPEVNNEPNNTVILAGDFNSVYWFSSIKELRKVLIEANRHNEGTFPAVGWILRPKASMKLDYIFHSPDVICTDTKVQLEGEIASDHLAFYASFFI